MSASPLKLALAAAFVLALTFTFSCSGDDSGGNTPPPRKEKISGVSQKGPFDAATVKIYRLDANNKKPIGDPFVGTTNDKGKFDIEIEEAQYISIEVTGNYANEAKGGQSEMPITLYAVADVSNKDSAKVNINVFTHLEYESVLKSTKAFDVAKREAQNKVLGTLGMGEINVNSESLDLFGNSPDDAKLLAASVLLQANRETGAVRDLLGEIGSKIKDGGDLSQQTKDELSEGAEWVKSNITDVANRIRELGATAQVPSVDDINNIIAGIDDFTSPDISSGSSRPLSSSSMKEDGSFTDSRDDNTYKTVTIGSQTWMAENLNYNVSSSICYSNDPANCSKYGKLYNWETAMAICPNGWHIPSKDEWEILKYFVEGNCSDCDGKHLKATSGWNSGGNGTDDYGFSAMPGGYGSSDGNFYGAGDFGIWWSASEDGSSKAYNRHMDENNDAASWYSNDKKSYLFSVRCLKD